MKPSVRASIRTAALLGATESAPVQVSHPELRPSERVEAPSALETAVGLEQVARFGWELKDELQRIRASYPDAEFIKAELREFLGEPLERLERLAERVDRMDERMTELAVRLQRIEDRGPEAELSEELARVRREYPTMGELIEKLEPLFGKPNGRVTQLEERAEELGAKVEDLVAWVHQQLRQPASAKSRKKVSRQ